MSQLQNKPDGMCKWWLMCANEATLVRRHPVLGDVPICVRCETKLRRMEYAQKHGGEMPGEGWDPGIPRKT